MHRFIAVFMLIVLSFSMVSAVVAAATTPEASPHASGSTREILSRATIAEFPPLPAYVLVSRITYAPGAGEVIGADDPGLSLVHIEGGTLTFRFDGAITIVTAAVPGTRVAESLPAPGSEFRLGVGEALMIPPGIGGGVSNRESGPASVLAVGIFPIEGLPASTPGASTAGESARSTIRFAPLALCEVDALPAPGELVLARDTLGASATASLPLLGGVAAVHVEHGTLSYADASEGSQFLRMPGAGTPGPIPIVATPGAAMQLSAGEALCEPEGSRDIAFHNTGDQSASLLTLLILPAGSVAEVVQGPVA